MRATSSKNSSRRGASLILAIVSLVFIIPMVGLAVDAAFLYVVKAQLQAAVDGASLAAARALSLGANPSAQSASAKQNAVDWFYANFPNGTWGTTNTQMNSSDTYVHVWNDTVNPSLQHVDITATTTVPTYFMKWLNFNSTTVTAQGFSSRRDVVAMLVLDRSGSMCTDSGGVNHGSCSTSYACGDMIAAAKTFTGQFAAGRDRVGLLSFSDGAFLHTAPTTNFQAVLGYSNSSGSAAGQIDNIHCNGGTGTAEAVSLAYNELYKLSLMGAFNFLVLETDGLPNTLTYNWWDGSHSGIASGSGCQDASGRTVGGGGWQTKSSMRAWTPGFSMNNPSNGYMGDIPAGSIGTFFTSDPATGQYFVLLGTPWQTGAYSNNNSIAVSSAPGCAFSGSYTSNYNDLAWLPSTDVYGNSVSPPNSYLPISLSNGHVPLTGSTGTDWPNTHAAALNATDNAAYNVRSNPTLPAALFVIGLGGNGGNPPDPVLLQRMANDPNGDLYNSPAKYSDCSQEANCVSYPSQPQGTFIYAPNSTQLTQAFLTLSSQVLRLNH